MKNIAETECIWSCTGDGSYGDFCPSEVGGRETCLYDFAMISCGLGLGGEN